MVKKEDLQQHLRGDGKLPVIHVKADNLAEATYKAIISCYEHGARIETPKQKPGMTLGYDADIIIEVTNPLNPPHICYPGIYDDARGVIQYILEVTHGIHNHWKKSEKHPDRWGYTYNERFIDQLPFIFQRINEDFKKKGRITGRDYQFTTWRAGEDIILEQEDPPCFQRGHLRFMIDKNGEHVLNYITDWRSRDLLKAWNENNLGQTGPLGLHKLFAEKVSDILKTPVKVGSYIDRSSSLHLYGLYIDRDRLDKQIERMKNNPYEKISCSLNKFIEGMNTSVKCIGLNGIKKLIAAQSNAELKGHGLNIPETGLERIGYDLDSFSYPSDWDTWPKEWNAKPNLEKLAKVLSKEEIYSKACNHIGITREKFEDILTDYLASGDIFMEM